VFQLHITIIQDIYKRLYYSIDNI